MILLATESKFKISVFEKLNLDFTTYNPDIDESIIQNDPNLSAKEKALNLSLEKAKKAAKNKPKFSTIIAADQLAVLDEEILTKPGSLENNLKQLERLSGKRHYLYTATTLVQNGEIKQHCDIAEMDMKLLCSEELKMYIEEDEPWMCAGGYKYEAGGAKLFSRVNVKDPVSIQGLSYEFLKKELITT